MEILTAFAREVHTSSKGLMVNIHTYLVCVCVYVHKENLRKMLFMCLTF